MFKENNMNNTKMYPEVTVREITADELNKILAGNTPKEIDLGDEKTTAKFRSLLNTAKQKSQHIFLLTWEGSKIPRGAEILGKTIAWTQHGIVRDSNGGTIGAYERLEEFGGKSGKEQRMTVFI